MVQQACCLLRRRRPDPRDVEAMREPLYDPSAQRGAAPPATPRGALPLPSPPSPLQEHPRDTPLAANIRAKYCGGTSGGAWGAGAITHN